jgi:hypothetical protein
VKVTPILAPAVDWQAFVAEVHAALGRSPSASLTMAGLKPGPLKTVPAALGEFQHRGTASIPFLKSRASDQVLGHLYVSFLVEGPPATVLRLLGLARLNPLLPDDGDGLVLFTGSLREWREMVLASARPDVAADVRAVATEVHRCLVRAGLGDLFADCVARDHRDGTVILEPGPRAR